KVPRLRKPSHSGGFLAAAFVVHWLMPDANRGSKHANEGAVSPNSHPSRLGSRICVQAAGFKKGIGQSSTIVRAQIWHSEDAKHCQFALNNAVHRNYTTN
ncbi:hypothetical protein ACTXN4_23800, partial [Pseudomonas helleri]|uniref:hypothetical protein n=1 Tax=Pseudomonas helleri TaxID=1608996 RepID=UPI003FD20521